MFATSSGRRVMVVPESRMAATAKSLGVKTSVPELEVAESDVKATVKEVTARRRELGYTVID
jgi:hypothetical protein